MALQIAPTMKFRANVQGTPIQLEVSSNRLLVAVDAGLRLLDVASAISGVKRESFSIEIDGTHYRSRTVLVKRNK